MKSMCQDSRRSSPSVAERSPTSRCMRTTSRIAASSIARSASAPIRRAAKSSLARSSSGGLSRLPTWSPRNGGRALAAPAPDSVTLDSVIWPPPVPPGRALDMAAARMLMSQIVNRITDNRPRSSRPARLPPGVDDLLLVDECHEDWQSDRELAPLHDALIELGHDLAHLLF